MSEDYEDHLDDCMDDDCDFEDEWEFDCHMGPDGLCGAAGSEDCDFECPVMADIIRAEARRRVKVEPK